MKSPLPQAASHRPVLLSVAFPYAPVGPEAVGGAEVICSQLEAAASSLGFRSVVVAHSGSRPEGLLYGTTIPPGSIDDAARTAVETAHQRNLDRACREHAIALVHMHGLDFHRYRVPEHLPVLVTLHLPPSWYDQAIWQLPSRYHLVCVSEAQRRACPAAAQPRLSVIPNGVPLPERSLLRPAGRYALLMARICPEKNLHVGLDAARLAGLPAVLAGEVFPYEAHQRYFSEVLQPRLTRTTHSHEQRTANEDGEARARFVGPVSGAEKDRLLRRAACLVLPSLAPETSSLVAMEALAAGVPVLAMAVGAVPSLVRDGHTGFLIPPGEHATELLADAIRRVPTLDRARCRAEAEARFPLAAMIERYAALYQQLALPQPGAPPACNSHTSGGVPALTVEPLHTQAALHRLREPWLALWQADPLATPFQHPDWLLPWWQQFGPDGQLHSIALRYDGSEALAGLFLTYLYTDPGSGRRQLLFLGAGTTDYTDGLWRPEAAPLAAGLALQTLLRGHGTEWDDLGLSQLRPSSPLLAAAAAFSLSTTPAEPCSALSVAAALPAKLRSNLARYRRLAQQRDALRCHLAEEPGEALASFDCLVHLHSRRWQSRGERGVLSDPRVLAHHRASLPGLLAAGLLRLFRLTRGEQTLGVLYGLADGPEAADRRLSLYLIGFDDRFADLSPGSLLVEEAWLHARAHGFRKLDLLRGGEAYKRLWGAEAEDTFSLRFRP